MRTKIVAFLLLVNLPCLGQVAVDLDWIFRSYRVFGRVMLEVFGSDKIQNMIDSEQSIGLWLNVDSLGYVTSVQKGRGKIPEPQLGLMVDSLRAYFKRHAVQFPICYALEDNGLTYEEQLKNALAYFHETKNKYTMVYFPGELLTSYEFDKYRGYKGSRFDYLLLKLNEQEIPIKRKISKGKTKGD